MEISMPFLPQSFPGLKTKSVCAPFCSEHEDVLSLLANYRRAMEYFAMLASQPSLLHQGFAGGPVEKCLGAIEVCESFVLRVFGEMEREGADRDALLCQLNDSLAATRLLLDMEIRKHAAHAGIVMVRLAGDGLQSGCDGLTLQGLAGQRGALVLAIETDGPRAGGIIRAYVENGSRSVGRVAQMPAANEGLTLLFVDYVLGELPEEARLMISHGDSNLILPIRCRVTEPAVLSVVIQDEQSGQRLACRGSLTDAYGQFHAPLGARTTIIPRAWPGEKWSTNYRFGDQPFFYCDGRFQVELPPGKFTLRLVRGFEYAVFETSGETAEGEARQIIARMHRVVDMPWLGWHSGQTHVHSQNLMPVNDKSGWEIMPDAEGLEVSFLSVFHQNEEIFTEEYPVGLIRHLSRDNYYLVVGEEFRHVPYGHMTFLNLTELVEPISSGRLGGRDWPDAPCNAQAIDLAHAQGAVACYCHLDARGPIVMNDELPIDAALGKVDCGEVMGAGGGYKYWYPMLNCGIRMGACAGPDWNLEDCCRVYVYTGRNDFTFQEWMEGLKAQRTFVTSGPMLFLTVNGQMPGSVLTGEAAEKLCIRGRALSSMPIERLEILMNGEVVGSAESDGEARELVIERELAPDRNCWIALRCFGQGAAHSSPVYVEVNGLPMGRPEDAAELLSISENCIRWTEQNGIFESEGDKRAVLALFRKGADYYRNIVDG